jgi:ABC-type dipeptide/oligopeptide/nickel transport system ATPase component
MLDLKRSVGAAIVLITHDLGVVAEIAERVMVKAPTPIFKNTSEDDYWADLRRAA